MTLLIMAVQKTFSQSRKKIESKTTSVKEQKYCTN